MTDDKDKTVPLDLFREQQRMTGQALDLIVRMIKTDMIMKAEEGDTGDQAPDLPDNEIAHEIITPLVKPVKPDMSHYR